MGAGPRHLAGTLSHDRQSWQAHDHRPAITPAPQRSRSPHLTPCPPSQETLDARAEAEHQISLAADPSPGAAPDVDEATYEMMSDAARDEFEGSRREHRRLVAAWEARRKALQVAKQERAELLASAAEAWGEAKREWRN